MLDTEVVVGVRAEVEGFVHLVVSGSVEGCSFHGLCLEDSRHLVSVLEGHLGLLHGSHLSEEGGLLELGGLDGLLSSYFSLSCDLLDDGISSSTVLDQAFLGRHDSGFGLLQKGQISGDSFLGIGPSFVSNLEKVLSDSDHLEGSNVVSLGSSNDNHLLVDDGQVLEVLHGFSMAFLEGGLVSRATILLLSLPCVVS